MSFLNFLLTADDQSELKAENTRLLGLVSKLEQQLQLLRDEKMGLSREKMALKMKNTQLVREAKDQDILLEELKEQHALKIKKLDYQFQQQATENDRLIRQLTLLQNDYSKVTQEIKVSTTRVDTLKVVTLDLVRELHICKQTVECMMRDKRLLEEALDAIDKDVQARFAALRVSSKLFQTKLFAVKNLHPAVLFHILKEKREELLILERQRTRKFRITDSGPTSNTE